MIYSPNDLTLCARGLVDDWSHDHYLPPMGGPPVWQGAGPGEVLMGDGFLTRHGDHLLLSCVADSKEKQNIQKIKHPIGMI